MTTFADFRARAFAFCERACGYSMGRKRSDSVYLEVVEKRDPGPGYSSCGDLAHAMLYALGVREDWVNRAEHRGFRWGMNVNLLTARPVGGGAGGLARDAAGTELSTGDVIVMWAKPDAADAHVCIVDSFDGLTLKSWDYGQGPMARDKWQGIDHVEGRRRERRAVAFDAKGRPVLNNGKTIRSVIPLRAVFQRLYGAEGNIA